MLMRYLAILILLMTFCLNVTGACGAQKDEQQVKAVFVLNFAKLADWPVDSHTDSSSFIIAILGKPPSATFMQTLQSQTVHGAKVTVRHADTAVDVKGANLVYISSVERQRLAALLRELSQQNILTVSDIPGFCEAGGMIGLVPVEKRIGFDINLSAVRKTRLVLSSQLLKLARKIIGN